MATTADPSLVLTELPTRPGSVIGRAYLWHGAVEFETMTLTTKYDADDNPIGHHWVRSGVPVDEAPEAHMSEILLRVDDWVLVGVVPLGDNRKGERVVGNLLEAENLAFGMPQAVEEGNAALGVD